MSPLREGGSRPSGFPVKSIYHGIKTGFNDAFIVDQTTRDALVAEDPRSAELLKPILRGRDIARYQANWAGLWLIDTHNGYAGVPPIDVDNYPAIKAHLDIFIGHLRRRQDKGVTPYNLRNCASSSRTHCHDKPTTKRHRGTPAEDGRIETMTLRAALYARYSSDQQRAASIEDQFRVCRERAAREDWKVAGEYEDSAVSGASMVLRPGVQALLEDARRGMFEIVVAEALDRVERRQSF